MISKGFRILLSYNFIPPCIAEKPNVQSSVSKNKTRYKGKMITTSKPTDYALWEEICYRYTQHIVERYGEETVASWYLQCYNEPDIKPFFLTDLDSSPESTNIRLQEYCKLYRGFANGIGKVSKKMWIGGPTLASRVNFLEGYLKFIKEEGLQLNYVCVHNYGTGPDLINNGTKPIDTKNNLLRFADYRAVVNSIFPEGIELVVDEWGVSSRGFHNREECPGLMFRENEIMAVYFGKLVTQIIEKELNISELIICLSGQHEMVEDFSGFRNLFTLNFIAKPIYNAFRLMARLGENVLQASVSDPNMTILATEQAGKHAVLLTYSSEHFDEPLPTLNEQITLAGLSEKTEITVTRIDAVHHNPYNRFLKEGFSADLTAEQVALLQEIGQLKTTETLETDGTFALSIPNNSLILLQW
jgi:xylan 1,4-beta-xylosidase